ncbi:Pre-mRNA-splicing factor CWC22 [Candida viswanathii]|uniref:Pre-mRNA-splicing factor CWC22 n=1 Tax=Candida viswanathii TaxID=5486 RepID=A0A367YPV6_9ASCO|nr:Pre-mRNA-splicing factor CWC22 [Candida viswanathii]
MNNTDLKPQSDEAFQRTQWMSAKDKINRLIGQLSETNVKETVILLFQLNIMRYRGLLVRRIMKQQLSHPNQSALLASLVSVINSKIPECGELLVKRVILQFKKNFTTNNSQRKVKSSLGFLCHLVNQQVASEIALLQVLQILLEKVNNDNVELSLDIVNTSGAYLFRNSKNALIMVLNRLRDLLQEDTSLSQRNRRAIGHVLKLGRSDFKGVPVVDRELDLVEDEDKEEPHVIGLDDDDLVSEDYLSVFHVDENYLENEKEYQELQEDVLGDNKDNKTAQVVEIPREEKVTDLGKSDLLQYQKTVYLTIMSSMSSDEAVHKLLKLNFGKSKEDRSHDTETLADMVIKCCSQEKTYSKYYGVIGEKLIVKNHYWHDTFVSLFKHYYDIIENFETNSLRNLGKFFGHLLASDRFALDKALNEIKLTESDTNPAKRILLKFIFQEMIEELGVNEVKERLINDEYVKPFINGIFPVTNATWKDADDLRFSINFFTAIGLGVLTEEMRDVLDNLPEERGRSRSRSYSRSGSSSSGSRSYSRSYSRSRSGSYSRSRSRSRSYSRSASPRGRLEFRSRKDNESRTPSRENLKRKRSSSSDGDNPKLKTILDGLN